MAFDFEGKPFARSANAGQLARAVATLDIPLVLVYNDLPAELDKSPFCTLVVSYYTLPSLSTDAMILTPNEILNTNESFSSTLRRVREKIERIVGVR